MNGVKPFRVGWPLACDELAEYDGDLYVHNSRSSGNMDSLPVEFFSHQLMNVDVSNDASVLSFVTSYGIPKHPSRYGPGGNIVWSHFDDIEREKKKTDSAFWETIDLYDGCWEIVTFEEVKLSIDDLQSAIREMFRCIRGEVEDWGLANVINSGATNPVVVHSGLLTFPDYSLTNAICNQVIETISDETEWKICNCEGCGRIFKHHQPEDGFSAKTGKNPSRSLYCCRKCQNRQGQRNRRAAAKARIQH